MTNVPRLTLDNGGELDRAGLHPRKASGDTDVPMESVGQDLSKERQRRGKKLSDVWSMLKIRPDFLAAIEESRFEALPGSVYAIGYVRSYAAYLGLDAEKLVDRLKVEIAARVTVNATGSAVDKLLEHNNFSVF
jgi:cytoskeleton protein RodZ